MILNDISRTMTRKSKKMKESAGHEENGRKYIKNKKLRPGRPGTSGRASPVKFWVLEKKTIFTRKHIIVYII